MRGGGLAGDCDCTCRLHAWAIAGLHVAGGLLDAEHGQDDRFRLLARVTGGSSPVQVLQPLRPALPDMGGPKYSAAWWDLVRSRGLDR